MRRVAGSRSVASAMDERRKVMASSLSLDGAATVESSPLSALLSPSILPLPRCGRGDRTSTGTAVCTR